MTSLTTGKMRLFPAIALIVSALLLSGNGAAFAGTPAGSRMLNTAAAQRCDGNRLMHEATDRYRMFYDYPYAAAQRMAAATKQYRMFYDYPYAASQRMAAATDLHCAGHP